jgi:uncharacterized membrane protein
MKLNRVFSFVLLVAILGGITAIAYMVNKGTAEKFTEFYILNTTGEAAAYPSELEVGKPAQVILGIINREQEATSYRVEIKVGNVKTGELGPIFLEHNGQLERKVSFTADKLGKNQKVEFILYRQGQTGVYESLYLWVDVIG